MSFVIHKLGLADNFKPTRHRAARPHFGRGGFQVPNPGGTADMSSFMNHARDIVAGKGLQTDYTASPDPSPNAPQATTLEVLCLAIAIFVLACILGFIVLIGVKTRRSRAQHEANSFPESNGREGWDSHDTTQVFINGVQRRSDSVAGQERNELHLLGRDETASLAPKHIFRPWRDAADERNGGIGKFDGTSTGLSNDTVRDSEQYPTTDNQGVIRSVDEHLPAHYGRRPSRRFDEGGVMDTGSGPTTHK
ncbi:hypothetical protein BDP81DRAFT_348395 [Colletotrichum phormii]|uniref:Uncharacterized protein n=1 Tax=Colletotrichum phormii TaxID=359342 RepID=A0AAJ0EFT9_9PEZI|nr:uncharacterized protein BDP81DRAFT_348395 [Colletotrichum phormii]KAK1637373.1 hypothetical protein BDP81DRAFT_348395 [Colletotrichum phormii]